MAAGTFGAVLSPKRFVQADSTPRHPGHHQGVRHHGRRWARPRVGGGPGSLAAGPPAGQRTAGGRPGPRLRRHLGQGRDAPPGVRGAVPAAAPSRRQGAGRGVRHRQVLPAGAGQRPLAARVDHSGAYLARAAAKFPGVPTDEHDQQELPYDDEFGGVLYVDAMEFVPPEDWPAVLWRFRRALHPRGWLYPTVELATRSGCARPTRRPGGRACRWWTARSSGRSPTATTTTTRACGRSGPGSAGPASPSRRRQGPLARGGVRLPPRAGTRAGPARLDRVERTPAIEALLSPATSGGVSTSLGVDGGAPAPGAPPSARAGARTIRPGRRRARAAPSPPRSGASPLAR
jgi:hypothetical protein